MKYKRQLALGAVILILLLYASTIVFALMDSPLAQSLLLASLFCTIVIPAVLYGYYVMIKYTKERTKQNEYTKRSTNSTGNQTENQPEKQSD